MKKTLLFGFVFGAMMCSCSESEEPRNEPDGPAQEETKAYKDVEPLAALQSWTPSAAEKEGLGSLEGFAYKLNGAVVDNYKEIWSDDKTGNYTLSPVSVSVFLSALSQCVDGEAREDLCRMLGLDAAGAAELNNKLLRYLSTDEENMQLSIANSVWHMPSMPVTEEFARQMALQFGAPVNAIDLYAPESKDVLNGWCADKTHGMIDNIFSEAPQMDFVLANALYFSSAWMETFDQKNTTAWTFNGRDGRSEVDMMHNPSLNAPYAEKDGVEYTSMSFGYGFVMDFIVPAADTDMDAFGKTLDASVLSGLMGECRGVELDFRLPRFKDNHQADILDVLTALGYPKYDLPTEEMTGSTGYPLYYDRSKVIHATALNVNEKGAELAAVTIGTWMSSPGEVPEYERVEMTIDRPFYYIIRNENCNAVLMIGRVCNL